MNEQLRDFVGWIVPRIADSPDGLERTTKQSVSFPVQSGEHLIRSMLAGKPAYQNESVAPNLQYLLAVVMGPGGDVELTVVSYRISRFASVGHVVTIEIIS